MQVTRLAVPASRIAQEVGLAVAGAVLIAASARVHVPMWPVPMTMQTFAVVLLGGLGGAGRGLAAAGLYGALAAAGAPVMAGAFGGPTTGYVVGCVLAAYAAGWATRQAWGRDARLGLALLVVSGLVFAPGLLWLRGFMPSWQATIDAGLAPFLVGDVVKTALATAVLLAVRRRGGVGVV